MAVDVLLLALSVSHVGSPKSRIEQAEILRQLSRCHTESHDHATAVARAKEAVRLEVIGTVGHGQSLKSLLAAFIAQGATASGGGDAQLVANEYMDHACTTWRECFEVCRDLADAGFSAECLQSLAQLRRRWQDNIEHVTEAWIFGVQILVIKVEEQCGSDESAVEHLCEMLDDIEAMPLRPRKLCERLSEILWDLSAVLFRRSSQAAAMWMRRCLFLQEELGGSMTAWRALAVCHRATGEVACASRCAAIALSHDPNDATTATLAIILAISCGEGAAARSILARATAKDFRLTLTQISSIVEETGRHPTCEMRLDCLEYLLHCVREEPESAAELGLQTTWILRVLMETVRDLGQSATRAADMLEEALIMLPSMSDGDARWFFMFAEDQGLALAKSQHWSESARLFGLAMSFAARLHIDPSTAGWCALFLAEATARDADNNEVQAEAARLRLKALSLVRSTRSALELCEQSDLGKSSELGQSLARLHLELLCTTESAALSQSLVEHLISIAASDPHSAASLARIAWKVGDHATAALCLQGYINMASNSEQYVPHVAAARRELIILTHCVGNISEGCEEISHEIHRSVDIPKPWKHLEMEGLWFAVASWNEGVGCMTQGKHDRAIRWMRKGLVLLSLLRPDPFVVALHNWLAAAISECTL